MNARLLLFAAWLVPCICSGGADPVRIHIDDPAGLNESWPLTCGVPFPKAALTDAAAVCLVNGAGAQVPCQVDVTAAWPDGSVRWVLMSFLGRPDGEYQVQGGERVQPKRVIRIDERASGTVIDTGPAQFVIPMDAALVGQVRLGGRGLVREGGRGAYVEDNRGRRAQLGGPRAEMETRVLQAGPTHACVRKEGWYVAEGSGERIARGIVWLHFFAGTPYVKIIHRLVLIEDTNKVWFRDLGIEVPMALDGERSASFDTSKAFDNEATSVPVSAGVSAQMIQDDFPHFMSDGSHFALTSGSTEIKSGSACGEWCDLSGGDAGLTVVLRDFAEQFPKQFTVSPTGITAHLWAGRSGRELDFRSATLVKEYWGEWCKYAPGGPEAIAKLPSNAQCSAKTHELWLMPHVGKLDVAATTRRAHAVTKRVLAYPDPAWTCSTGAMGLPLLHKDTARFPEHEQLISDFFDRIVLPYRIFPMTGYIAWGCNPYLRYGKDRETGKWYAVWYRLRWLVEYNLRRNVWTLYGRSGERKYLDWGEHFNQFAGDMEMHHWDVGEPGEAGSRIRGGFVRGGDIHKPFYWGKSSEVLTHGSSGTDIVNYLSQFYFTGDWHVRELAENYGYALKQVYDFDKVCDGPSPFLIFRCICALYAMDWDDELGKMTRDVAHRIIDLKSPNGLYEKMGYGPLYKVTRNVSAIMDYWLLTGDEHAKKGFLKAVDYQYRFQRDGLPIAYQNGAGMYYTMAYRFTKRPAYLRLANQSVMSALKQEPTTLAEDLAPGLDGLDRLPYRGVHLQLHPLFSTPIVLKLLSEVNEPIPPYPLLKKSFDSARAWAVFEKRQGEPFWATMYYVAPQGKPIEPALLGPDQNPVQNARVQKEARIPYYSDKGTKYFHVRVELPAELPAGDYRLGISSTDPFTIMDASADRMVLECSEGVWLGGGGLGAGAPVIFHVPEGKEQVRLYLGREVKVIRSDGRVVKDVDGRQIGDVTLPVEGKAGFWRLEFHEPALVRFRNLDPLVAFGTEKRYFRPASLIEVTRPAPQLPPDDATFVPGVIGQALQLNGRDLLRYARGKRLDDGSFENFPGEEGTIELYFRPNWSTLDFPVLGRRLHHLRFVTAGQLSFYHRCGQGPMANQYYSFVDLLCRGPWGTPPAVQEKHCGNQARLFFRAGEWYHLAATWKIDLAQKKKEDKALFFVFVNGEKRQRCWFYPHALDSYKPFHIGEIAEWIQIGANAKGTFDELRISDVVRYNDHFEPPKQALVPDEHTKALFHFDGSAEGSGADGKTLEVEYRDRN